MFIENDYVRLKNGHTKMIVKAVSRDGKQIIANYVKESDCSFNRNIRFRPYYDFIDWDGHPAAFTLSESTQMYEEEMKLTRKEDNIMTKLFCTKEETPRFGTLLATDSNGRRVMEMKETGKIETFLPNDIEEVIPYTVCVVYLVNGTTEAHIAVEKGSCEVGDLLFVGDKTLAYVKELDTKANKTTWNNFPVRKITTTPL